MTFVRSGKERLPAVQWRAAVYVRLSKEDGDKLESDSIQNQKRIIEQHIQYLRDQGEQIVSVEVYSDDGCPGGSFDRPAYKRMMGDVEAGKVNCVIFKDNSRLGRNYPELGRAARRHGVRGEILVLGYTHPGNFPLLRRYRLTQAAAFQEALCSLRKQGLSYGKAHLLSSYGLLNYPELGGAYARVGIALYGVLSGPAGLETCPVELRPVLSLKARVASVRDLPKGQSAGYGFGYTAEGGRRIAVLSIGYADGLPRSLSRGRGRVLIRGEEAPIIGSVCMDQTLVDVTDIPGVRSGDTAVLIGRSGRREITAYDLAEAGGTITNEVLSRLGPRLNRTAAGFA